MIKTPVVLMWFRLDLRLHDNPALNAAIETAKALQAQLVPIYIASEQNELGSASRVWLHHSLQALNTDLFQELGVSMSLFQLEEPLAVFERLKQQYEVKGIYWNRCYEPSRILQDQAVKSFFKSQAIACQSFNGSLLWEPWDVTKADGEPYRVFTPFFRKGCLSARSPRTPVALTKLDQTLLDPIRLAGACELNDMRLLPSLPWANAMMSHWHVGERAAHTALQVFLENGLTSYKEKRNHPAQPHVSRLSPYLHFGEISVNQVWYAVKAHSQTTKTALDVDVDHFCSELAWREFSYHLLFYHPDMPSRNLQKKFDVFAWQFNASFFQAWKRGQTGYPIVDAGMRELWQTGYIHNRVRMVVASFLVKNLLIDWRLGAQWFLDCLVDADLANNSASWQWVAGCGMDAAPYFRVFNPVLQGEKFDADGAYVKRFVPELARLPGKYLFCPWDAPAGVLQQAGVSLGKTYPNPIVDLSSSRDLALSHFKQL